MHWKQERALSSAVLLIYLTTMDKPTKECNETSFVKIYAENMVQTLDAICERYKK